MQPRIAVVVLALAGLGSVAAQQRVPLNDSGIPIAPQGLHRLAPPPSPVRYATAEGQDIAVETWVTGLSRPWSIAFVAPDTALVTERTGALRVIRGGVLNTSPVEGAPSAKIEGLSGLMDLALHPAFARNGFVYFSYNKALADDESALAIARGRWDGTAVRDTSDLFVAAEGTAGVSRLAFGPDGSLYMSFAGGNEGQAQDPMSHRGKVLRLKDDGSVPADNPFVGRAGYLPEIFTLGHRSTLGLAAHPTTGKIWQLEMGPNGGDEINILEPGANYGWPLVSLGRTYPGPWQSQNFQQEGFADPVVFWMPSIATSGLAFYTGDALPKWKGDIFVGGMRYGEVPNTGRLERILVNENMEELRREPLLTELRLRIRDVRQGPDGLLYLLTDYDQGAVLRIFPAR